MIVLQRTPQAPLRFSAAPARLNLPPGAKIPKDIARILGVDEDETYVESPKRLQDGKRSIPMPIIWEGDSQWRVENQKEAAYLQLAPGCANSPIHGGLDNGNTLKKYGVNFFVFNPQEQASYTNQSTELIYKAIGLLNEIVTSEKGVAIVHNKERFKSIYFIVTGNHLSKTTNEQAYAEIQRYLSAEPKLFVEIASSKDFTAEQEFEQLLEADVLQKEGMFYRFKGDAETIGNKKTVIARIRDNDADFLARAKAFADAK